MNLIRVVERVHEIFVVISKVEKLETLRLFFFQSCFGEFVVIFRVGGVKNGSIIFFMITKSETFLLFAHPTAKFCLKVVQENM